MKGRAMKGGATTFDLGAGIRGKRVLLTGAGGGIGREVALAYAGAGAYVACVDLAQGPLDELMAQMEGGPHLALAHDLRPVAGIDGLVAQAATGLGGIDVLVQAAAVLVRRPSVIDVTEADWGIRHDINLKSAFFRAQAAARVMVAQGSGGRIINFIRARCGACADCPDAGGG